MLMLDLEDFQFELKDGAIKHVGASNRTATGKLYDVDSIDVRAFGDERAKVAFTDEDGNEIEVALFPEQATELAGSLEALAEDSAVFE